MTPEDIGAELRDQLLLGGGIRMDVAIEVDDLDADRRLVESVELSPAALAGMVGHLGLGHHGDDARRVFIGDQVMDADAMARLATLKHFVGAGQVAACVMEDQSLHGHLAGFRAQRVGPLFDPQTYRGMLRDGKFGRNPRRSRGAA